MSVGRVEVDLPWHGARSVVDRSVESGRTTPRVVHAGMLSRHTAGWRSRTARAGGEGGVRVAVPGARPPG
jgi:hypothetical protein